MISSGFLGPVKYGIWPIFVGGAGAVICPCFSGVPVGYDVGRCLPGAAIIYIFLGPV
ncbi:hypothetical protein NG798_25225 [Ancylothrix sp. C2]|uniref:hypothetical protein n=1 Tax=Ancylothrix sp. D3o TaxID=2953691 RepID=UPI0021BB8072|nr:hypothetical protein [Ancylothrix sp. D3o]MCT7953104.1 hypothetical protein [Ancylothrix sp. D3o]